MKGDLTKIERCEEYWNRLPEYNIKKYFTELKEKSHEKWFDELEESERELVVEHISRVLKLD